MAKIEYGVMVEIFGIWIETGTYATMSEAREKLRADREKDSTHAMKIVKITKEDVFCDTGKEEGRL